ncbi:unnamed protein product [Phytophthora fragariaefolia]|uniref:Unnamed protein product n=1 Tax=Phytophthora fragariaefolia TaxID=1490495 RepID=A0A9W6TJC0_9STRA|nr:unnamed protein product [Phytophthora fragariaefolia]
MAAHTSFLREASEKVGHQAREIETLRDVVHHPSSPRGQVRWGWFAQPPPDEADDVKMEDTAEDGHSGGGEGHSGEGLSAGEEGVHGQLLGVRAQDSVVKCRDKTRTTTPDATQLLYRAQDTPAHL